MDKVNVIEDLQILFKQEIKNFFLFDENEILIYLGDGTKVKITTNNVT